jgi:RNA polymerase sigma-70 factor (ECF subfamily)
VNREAFQEFYEETAAALRAYLRMTCKHWALADDLMQETYLRMLRQKLRALEVGRRKAYLYKTAHSVLADHYRARRREEHWNAQQSMAGSTEHCELSNFVGGDCGAASNRFDLPIDMQSAFEALKAKQQTLLWLAYVEGFNHDEIAEVIGVNSASVRVLLSRARATLAAPKRRGSPNG